MSRTRNAQRLETFFATLSAELSSCNPSNEAVRFAIKRQVSRARKRAQLGKSSVLSARAIDDFKTINARVGATKVALDRQVESNARHFVSVVLERFTASFDEEAIQQPLNLDFLYDNWRFGPGASYGIKGSHTVEKIGQEMTCTAQNESLVLQLRASNVYMSSFDYKTSRAGNSLHWGVRVVRGSKLTTVPKNEDTERTIAIEPSGSMALQLAAGRYLEGALRSIGLDISKQQPKNKALAARGSVDGSFATIDLKSASDMISIDLVRRIMPPDWFWLLSCLRSQEIELPDGSWERLNMISTMGNGFTFPLMTLILCSLIYGYRCKAGGPSLFIDWTRTAVFGDDIIVPSTEFAGMCQVLQDAGLIVNHDKSFSEGPFRESCGGDYYEGYDVTPFYVKTLSRDPDVYVAINQLMDFCGKHLLVLTQSLQMLRGYLDGKVHLVPEWMNPNQGILTALVPKRYTYLSIEVPRRALPFEANHFLVPLAIGGYVSSSAEGIFFVPRPRDGVKVRVLRSRLPKGFLDGAHPGKRCARSSGWIASLLAI